MRLEWFRSHKTVVYYLLLPMVVISFVLFNNSGSKGGSSLFGEKGPRLEYVVGNKQFHMSPSEVVQKRLAIWHFDQGGQPKTDDVGYRAAALELAKQLGFSCGPEEEKEHLKQIIEYKIQSYDRGGEAKATAENYKKLLTTMEMAPEQFVERVHEEAVLAKLFQNLSQNMIVSDTQLYPSYSKENESIRILYKTIKAKDFKDKTKAPEDSAVKTFFDENTKEKDKDKEKPVELDKIAYKDILVEPMKMSVEALAYKNEKEVEVPAPTADDLQKYYDQWKHRWKEPTPAPANPPAVGANPPPEKFKPFETVKAEVEKSWREDKKMAVKSTFVTKMSTLMTDLAAEEDKFKKDEANKGKEFDIKAWAAKHNLTYWVTPEQPKAKYQEGKNEFNAPDIKKAMSLWFFAETTDPSGKKRSDVDIANFRKSMNNFTSFEWFDFEKPELGGAWVRAKKFSDEHLKTLEEAKPAIIEHLRSVEADNLAKEAAKKLHDEWQKGENLPKLEELDEVTSDDKKDHPLIKGFKRAPKAIGEVMDVESGQPEDAEVGKKKDEGYWYYVGTCVERKPPAWNKYALVQDADFSRSTHRQQARGQDYFSAQGLLEQRIKDNVHKFATGGQETDVPLGDVVRSARSDQ